MFIFYRQQINQVFGAFRGSTRQFREALDQISWNSDTVQDLQQAVLNGSQSTFCFTDDSVSDQTYKEKKNIKRAGIAQNVCKQGRDDVRVKVNMRSPIPVSFKYWSAPVKRCHSYMHLFMFLFSCFCSFFYYFFDVHHSYS